MNKTCSLKELKLFCKGTIVLLSKNDLSIESTIFLLTTIHGSLELPNVPSGITLFLEGTTFFRSINNIFQTTTSCSLFLKRILFLEVLTNMSTVFTVPDILNVTFVTQSQFQEKIIYSKKFVNFGKIK